MIDLLIFDLDGTLVDSKDDITDALNAALKSFSLAEVPAEVVAKYVGTGIRPLMDLILSSQTQIEFKSLDERFAEFYIKNIANKTCLYPGIQSLLEEFASVPKTILTNKAKKFTEPLVDALGIRSCFEAVYSRDSFAKSKPDPLPIFEICKIHTKSPSSRVIMIGDTPTDLKAAAAVPVSSCALYYGYGTKDELDAHEATFRAPTVEYLSSLLRKLHAQS